MSSLRNAVKRITHKERSQLQSRKHLGILEKKKDYKERSVDYHKKQDRVKAMRQKAAMRNPDEFYFGMHTSAVKDGHHRREIDETRNQLDNDMIRLLKDQDLAYVRMQKQRDLKKAERIGANLHFLDEGVKGRTVKNKHTIFLDSKSEAEDFDVAKHFDTAPELAGRVFNRPRTTTLREEALKKAATIAAQAAGPSDDGDDDDKEGDQKMSFKDLKAIQKAERKGLKKAAKERAAAYREMEERRKRAKQMEIAAVHLETEKNMAAKGRKRKIKGAEGGMPAQFKWRRRRLG